MPHHRLFLPQRAIDYWLDAGYVRIVDDNLTFQRLGLTLQLEGALHFQSEVTTAQDPHNLVGKVKTVLAVQALEGEHFADSVVLGDNAYAVDEGFLASPLDGAVGTDLASLTRLIMEL